MRPRLLVCGSRNWADHDYLYKWLDRVDPKPDMIIHGDARGADHAAGIWARTGGITEVKVPAQWEAYGKGAGPRRNKEMLRLEPHVVVGFPLGNSAGTHNMMDVSRKAGFPVINAVEEGPEAVAEAMRTVQQKLFG